MPRVASLVPGIFVERPNRFVVCARRDNGETVEAHLADPGRLVELLLPGAELRLRPAAEGSSRRTHFSVALVRSPAAPCTWVSLEAARANGLVEELWTKGELPRFDRSWDLRREVRHGDSRFDFRFERNGHGNWLEVKSVTLVERGIGLFPDAPTARGRRHVTELIRLARDGEGAGVLFVVQRGDVNSVRAHDKIDPEFAALVREARDVGVTLDAIRFELSESGHARFTGRLPVD